jgi:tetratricopeptide (TPR) repeat protein
LKQRILLTVQEGRVKESELDAVSTDVPANADRRWNAKDHLAHLAWWRDRDARMIDAVRTGGTPPPAVEDDAQNAITYQTYRDRPLGEIREFARTSWDRVIEATAACSEADLIKPHPYSSSNVMWQTVCGVAFDHTGTHLTYWYLETGDVAKAEGAQRWWHDMHMRVAVDARHRAYAAYNLACFYARLGRAGEALPLLRQSFEWRPDLREHAHKDTDLDQIRDNSAVRLLLAT